MEYAASSTLCPKCVCQVNEWLSFDLLIKKVGLMILKDMKPNKTKENKQVSNQIQTIIKLQLCPIEPHNKYSDKNVLLH